MHIIILIIIIITIIVIFITATQKKQTKQDKQIQPIKQNSSCDSSLWPGRLHSDGRVGEQCMRAVRRWRLQLQPVAARLRRLCACAVQHHAHSTGQHQPGRLRGLLSPLPRGPAVLPLFLDQGAVSVCVIQMCKYVRECDMKMLS